MFTEDVEATVRRVIRRCLEHDPSDRPASAREVAAGLPGGDPLAAALAAGETPSPEMVAASGETGQLSLRTAGFCLAVLLIGLACLVVIMGRTSATIDLDKSADGYAERADNMLDGLGLDGKGMYEDWGFTNVGETPRRMEFWYRRSPQSLVPVLDARHVREARVVTLQNPPPLVPGMVSVRLSSDRKLRELLVIPSKQVMAQLPDAAAVDSPNGAATDIPNTLLELAGLKRADFQPNPVKWTRDDLPNWPPPSSDYAYSLFPLDRSSNQTAAQVADDDRTADDGAEPGIMRVDFAQLDGRIVFFHVADTASPAPQTISPPNDPGLTIGPVLSVLITLIAMILAWRNVLSGRSDSRTTSSMWPCGKKLGSDEQTQMDKMLQLGQELADYFKDHNPTGNTAALI